GICDSAVRSGKLQRRNPLRARDLQLSLLRSHCFGSLAHRRAMVRERVRRRRTGKIDPRWRRCRILDRCGERESLLEWEIEQLLELEICDLARALRLDHDWKLIAHRNL